MLLLPPDSYPGELHHIPLISSFSATLPPDSYRESYSRLWHDRQQGICCLSLLKRDPEESGLLDDLGRRPAPTVRLPPFAIAKRAPLSIATGWMSSTVMVRCHPA